MQYTNNAAQWLAARTWAQGITLQPHPSVNAQEFHTQFQKNTPLWAKVFEFIGSNNLATIAPGKYAIEGDNAYAIITEGPSKPDDMAKWEAHLVYIDLQYVIAGAEDIEVTDVAQATCTVPYIAEKDVAKYTAQGNMYRATPQSFFLFFPQDVHRPNIAVEGVASVKKMVIKIRRS